MYVFLVYVQISKLRFYIDFKSVYWKFGDLVL